MSAIRSRVSIGVLRTFAARHIERITQMGDFTQRRRVAELKRFADDCAKLHAAALVAVVLIAQKTPQPETTRRPSWLRLARFCGFSVLSQDRRVPNIQAKACSLRACGPQGRLSLPAIHLSRPATHPSRRGSAQASRTWISPPCEISKRAALADANQTTTT